MMTAASRKGFCRNNTQPVHSHRPQRVYKLQGRHRPRASTATAASMRGSCSLTPAWTFATNHSEYTNFEAETNVSFNGDGSVNRGTADITSLYIATNHSEYRKLQGPARLSISTVTAASMKGYFRIIPACTSTNHSEVYKLQGRHERVFQRRTQRRFGRTLSNTSLYIATNHSEYTNFEAGTTVSFNGDGSVKSGVLQNSTSLYRHEPQRVDELRGRH